VRFEIGYGEEMNITDATRIYEATTGYSRNPALFSEDLSHEENVSLYYDQSHVASHKGRTYEADLDDDYLSRVVRQRRSTREFTGESTTEKTLLKLLWYMYGRTGEGIMPGQDSHYLTFTVPSGGGLYPCHLYVILLKDRGRPARDRSRRGVPTLPK